jgi:basic amino acid/polyamine antiporter, APA family
MEVSPEATIPQQGERQPALLRQLGLFDSTMLVMGGIVGSGLFINPYVVAQRVHTPLLILAAWIAGGCIAMLGAFIYAELADRLPDVGGQYAYLRTSFHPLLGFLYGWVLLTVIMAGGMAAVAVTFARYFLALTGLPVSEHFVVLVTLASLTVVNCLGAKQGSRVQSVLMVLKIAVTAGVILAGLVLIRNPFPVWHPVLDRPPSFDLFTAFGSAMIPVLFAYGGWQTSNFVASEIKDPRRNLTRALIIGVSCVIALYVAMNFVCVRALGPAQLANTRVPASDVMFHALGKTGASLAAVGIAVSTLGFLSQCILTGPRVYFAMAEDGVFFKTIAKISRKTRVPVAAIVLQSTWAAIVALLGSYEQILNYVVSMDFLFFGLSAACLFVLRRRERQSRHGESPGFRAPGHPFSTLIFIAASWLIVVNTIYKYPRNALAGFAILVVGIPIYLAWRMLHLKRNHRDEIRPSP